MPTTMPTLLMTAITVVRQRSDICIPRIAANADTMISMPAAAGPPPGRRSTRSDGSSHAPIRRTTSYITNISTLATGTATSGSTKLTSPRSLPQM